MRYRSVSILSYESPSSDGPSIPTSDQNLLEAVALPTLLQACQAVLDTGGDEPSAMLETRFQLCAGGLGSLAPYPATGAVRRYKRRAFDSWTGSGSCSVASATDWPELPRPAAFYPRGGSIYPPHGNGDTTQQCRTSPPSLPMLPPTNGTWGVKSAELPACRQPALANA